ncbi:MAG: LytR C-terminal domain-containing protein [Ignavibacteriales bacterium]
MTNKKNSKSGANVDVKKSTANILLNVFIFLLGAIILYMGYAIFAKVLHSGPETETANKTQNPSVIIQAEVLNGCGIGGVADRFTDFLRKNNVDIVNVSNYTSFDIDRTMVIDRTGNMANARKIASLLGIKNENVIQQINNDYFVDVSVVIGRDYNQLKPLK